MAMVSGVQATSVSFVARTHSPNLRSSFKCLDTLVSFYAFVYFCFSSSLCDLIVADHPDDIKYNPIKKQILLCAYNLSDTGLRSGLRGMFCFVLKVTKN